MKKILEVDRRIKTKPTDLLEEPVVIRLRDFTEESADKFSQDLSKAHATGQPVAPVIIDSFGGQVYSFLAIVSEIEQSSIPVATIAVGKAMSCGALLLGLGTKGYRFADPNVCIMLHDMSSSQCGKIEELKSSIKEIERLQKLILRKLATHCGHTDFNFFADLIHNHSHSEVYLTAKQAKRYKLIDSIHMPQFKTVVSVDISFE